MQKIKVYHFHNGSGGGVLSVIRNLLKFSTNRNIENHIIYTINKNQISNYIPELIDGAITTQIFYYTPKNNFYYTCKQFAKLLPNKDAVIVAHDWLEIAVVSNLGLENPVVQFLHGDIDYYYELGIKNNFIIDTFICISKAIYSKFTTLLPSRLSNTVHLNFPVPEIKNDKLVSKTFNIIYYVRNLRDERKKLSTIINIANHLNNISDFVFTIAGDGYSESEFKNIWMGNIDSLNFIGYKTNEEVIKILSNQDIFLLPSVWEGLPVGLVEAMKAGVVPLVTNWNNATEELLLDGRNGFYIPIDDVDLYVEKIKFLHNNRNILKEFSLLASKKATELFDPIANTTKIESVIEKTIKPKKIYARKVYGSRLDHPLIPNFITSTIRNFL